MSPFPGAPPISLPGGYTAKQVSAALLCYGAKNCTMHTLLTMTCRLLKVYVQCAHFVVLTLPAIFGIPLAISCIAIQIATQRFHNVKQQ